MTGWSGPRLTLRLWLARKMIRALARFLLVIVLPVVAWPVTLVVAAGYASAWLRGWPPARLGRTAIAVLPFTALAAADAARRGGRAAVRAAARAAGHAWARDWTHPHAAGIARAFMLAAPVSVPAGLAIAAGLWAWRNYALTTGLAGRTASAPIAFDQRQWKWQVRAAKGRLKAPGAAWLLARKDRIPIGATIRTSGHPWQPIFTIPAVALGSHQVFVGATGMGKTNVMMRTWAGWFTSRLGRFLAGKGDRPLLIVLDAKGGRDARKKAARTRRLLYGAGARRVAIWPDDATLNLWTVPPEALAVLLFQMIESGAGSAAYYADITQAVIWLAVAAPAGPPADSASFLARLNADWLTTAWGDGYHPEELRTIHAAAPHIGDVRVRYATLLRRLGPAMDGPGTLDDADAWYFILEGTSEPSVAEAQALAITDLAAYAATRPDGPRREILLALDDYSAISRRVPVSNLYERGRALGIGVQVSAQSWHGLGRDDDERHRITDTADGGVFVLQTPYPQPFAELAGTRRVLATAHKLIGAAWGDEGSTREQHAWTADPDLIRHLTVGQACYIRQGGVTWVQVARPRPSPLTLLPPDPPGEPPAEVPEPRRESAWPDLQPASFDDHFGPGAAP